jgi:PhnB protein
LFFDGRCEEAIEFYRQSLGAEVEMLMRFKDSPEPAQCGSASGDKVMHASFRVGETTVMASDGRCEGKPSFQGFALALSVPTEAEADRRFAALAKGAGADALARTFFHRASNGRRPLRRDVDDYRAGRADRSQEELRTRLNHQPTGDTTMRFMVIVKATRTQRRCSAERETPRRDGHQ